MNHANANFTLIKLVDGVISHQSLLAWGSLYTIHSPTDTKQWRWIWYPKLVIEISKKWI